ncbi:hypothetical protein ACFONG_15845 [Uliginosibacterium paludis]|uniref:Uncharacterized protein n=1 Tax=Uliginosibacterium paludis TaxID=1615952 RepID=A0ABV2CUL7_9RHOO
MKPCSSKFISQAFQTFTVLLAAYGIFGLSRFSWYSGEYFDERLIIFDNGFYPFSWAVFLLVLSQVLRLHARRMFMGSIAASGLLVFVFKLMTLPKDDRIGQELFPSPDLLEGLVLACVILLGLVLMDKFIQQGIDWAVVRPFRALRGKLAAR